MLIFIFENKILLSDKTILNRAEKSGLAPIAGVSLLGYIAFATNQNNHGQKYHFRGQPLYSQVINSLRDFQLIAKNFMARSVGGCDFSVQRRRSA